MTTLSTNIVFIVWTIIFVFPPQPAEGVKGTWIEEFDHPYSNLVQAGQEGGKDYPTYICRADLPPQQYTFMGELIADSAMEPSRIPGKFVPIMNKCYVALGNGSETQVSTFRLLLDRGYQWEDGDAKKGTIGENVIEAGYTNTGEKLYICRTKKVNVGIWGWEGKAVLIGATAKGWSTCFASWNNQSKAYNNFEVLVEPEKERSSTVI